MGHTDRAALIAWVKKEARDWKMQAKDDGVHERHSGMVYAERQHQHFDAIASLLEAEAWQPIATAPKGSWLTGPNDTRDPAYVEPPSLLLFTDDGICVGYADAYYAEGGWGFNGDSFWVSGGEQVTPTHWRPIPAPPVTEAP